MQTRDVIDLALLAALWGGSYLFMRVAVPEFGPFALIEVRVLLAALLLLPILLYQAGSEGLRKNWRTLLIVGAMNSAVPFTLFAYATLYVTAGFAGVVNACAPLFAAIFAVVWLGDRLSPLQVVGLLVGLSGVVILVWDKITSQIGGESSAVGAILLATVCYGWAASYIKKTTVGIEPLTMSTGSMLGAALLLLPFAIWHWPQGTISTTSWMAVSALAVFCTGTAYILYFRLIANVGPTRAISVTYLVPLFAVLWGALFLGEAVTLTMIIGGSVILSGTALVTGMLPLRRMLR